MGSIRVRLFCRAFIVSLSLCACNAHLVMAQAPARGRVAGRVVDSVSGEPVPNAVVVIGELRREVTSGTDGSFAFDGVPPGSYHLSVRSEGYSARRTEVVLGPSAPVTVELRVDPELHFEEVLSVAPDARSQFESFQATSVLAGQELTKQLEMSLGATLESQPGVASRSFGPAPSRPVIRGLDGDRVLILQDGQRMGDLSSQSGDHGVAVNPAAAHRIEVVRGPATLLYGANAIGGLVNVITEDIPTRPVTRATGNFTFDLASAAREAGAAGDIHVGNGTLALHAGGGGRRSTDVRTPAGPVVNSQSRSGFGSVGLSWTGASGYFGGSYGYDDSRYGIPVIEDGQVQLTPRRHAVTLRGGATGRDGVVDSYRGTLSVRRYRHEELEGGEIGTAFTNNTTEMEVMGSHRAVGRMKGSAGVWALNRAFDAVGAEALSPPVDQKAYAAFLYEELTWPHVTFQFGGRVDHTRYDPAGEDARRFTSGSASLGVLFRPAAAHDRVTIAVSAARAARNPALEELFYFGEHHGNFAFEIGNPDLGPEHALGFDLSLRWRSARASGEVTYFRNDIRNYVFRAPLTEEAFESREDEIAARFPSRTAGGHADEGEEGEAGEVEEPLPIVEYVAADSVLQGIEAHADFRPATRLALELGLDYVHGTLSGSGQPLPRIPPLRVRGGVRYDHGPLQVGGQLTVAARQTRVFPTETDTGGYGLARLFGAYTFASGGYLHTVTARLDNVTNELYRNHLSLIKDFVPEVGRNFKLLYNVKF